MTEPLKLNTDDLYAKVRAQAEDALTKTLASLDPQALALAVIKDLNKAKFEVIMAILGVEVQGKYVTIATSPRQISPISAWLAGKVEEPLKRWLVDATKEVLTDARYETRRKAVMDQFNRELDSKLRYNSDRIRQATDKLADQIQQEVIGELITGRTK